IIVNDFAVPGEAAMGILQQLNARCAENDRWNDAELRHKLDDALAEVAAAGGPNGRLLVDRDGLPTTPAGRCGPNPPARALPAGPRIPQWRYAAVVAGHVLAVRREEVRGTSREGRAGTSARLRHRTARCRIPRDAAAGGSGREARAPDADGDARPDGQRAARA